MSDRAGFATADLWDAHEDEARVLDVPFVALGSRPSFHGSVSTLQVFEDNVLVRAAVEEPGRGRVLVIDGGGSRRCALVGDKLAGFAAKNGWAGIVVNGCVRDAAVIATIEIGVRALGTTPVRSAKIGAGKRDVPVSIGGVLIAPGEHLYADADGVLVAPRELT